MNFRTFRYPESDSFFGGGEGYISVTHYHPYFQWVPFILLLQGITFHIPQLVWSKFVEKGRLASLCALTSTEQVSLNPESLNCDEDGTSSIKECATQTPQLVLPPGWKSFASTLHSSSNKRYFSGFMLCEMLNILMVLITIFTTEWFLGGRFILMGV